MKASGRVSKYIKRRLEERIKGHPSREEQQKIQRLENLVFELAKQIDNIRENNAKETIKAK